MNNSIDPMCTRMTLNSGPYPGPAAPNVAITFQNGVGGPTLEVSFFGLPVIVPPAAFTPFQDSQIQVYLEGISEGGAPINSILSEMEFTESANYSVGWPLSGPGSWLAQIYIKGEQSGLIYGASNTLVITL